MARKAARRKHTSTSASTSPPLSLREECEPRLRVLAASVLSKALINAKLVEPNRFGTTDYGDLLWRFKELLQPEGTRALPENVVALFRGDILGTLVQLLEDLAPLNRFCCENEDLFNDSIWYQAINILRALAFALGFLDGQERYNRIKEWQNYTPRLAAVFAAIPWISSTDPPAAESKSYNTLRMLCLESLRPGIPISGEPDHPLPNPGTLRSLIPFLALLRKPMANGPPELSEAVLQMSAALFAMCLMEQKEGLRLRDETGVSFRELIVPCLKVPLSGGIQDLTVPSIQFKLLQLIISLELDEAILETICLERVITHTASFAKRIMRESRTQYRRRSEIEDVTDVVSRWSDSMCLIWGDIMAWAGSKSPMPTSRKLVKEVLESRLMFQLEYWSVSAPDDLLKRLAYIIRGCALCACTTLEPAPGLVLFQQIRIVCRRLSARSDIKPGVLRAWVKEYNHCTLRPSEAPLEPQTSDENICAAIGCDRIDSPPPTVCGRCRVAHYCSTECQAIDWKSHKASCSKVA